MIEGGPLPEQVAAQQCGVKEIVDPRPFAVGTIKETYAKYPTTGPVLPAMGYGDAMIRELEETINRSDADIVLIGTPIDLGRPISGDVVELILDDHRRFETLLRDLRDSSSDRDAVRQAFSTLHVAHAEPLGSGPAEPLGRQRDAPGRPL